MNSYKAISLLVVFVASVTTSALLVRGAVEQQTSGSGDANKDRELVVSEEMHLITKSLDDLMGELQNIKKEANGRLSNMVKNRASTSDQERIRQTVVSRFVLKRVAELERESDGMRAEMLKVFKLASSSGKPSSSAAAASSHSDSISGRQEDHDFDAEPPAPTSSTTIGTTTSTSTSTSTSATTNNKNNEPEGMPASTTLKPTDEEAAKIGFDVEALKKLGLELEEELEARQRQNPESLRGVHEQVIKLIDNMVQNYLGNVRRTVQRMTQFIDNRRSSLTNNPQQQQQIGQPKIAAAGVPSSFVMAVNEFDQYNQVSRSILNRVEDLSKEMNEFTTQWTSIVGRQQSPLFDRIPARGVELWRDFWDTARKQVRRINQEFRQLSQDMARLVTGRLPSSRGPTPGQPAAGAAAASLSLLYSADSLVSHGPSDGVEKLSKIFQEFHDRMSVALGEEQKKMDSLKQVQSSPPNSAESVRYYEQQQQQQQYLIDEQEDQQIRDELIRNVALRQQIQQEINVFGSIFDIMRAFMQRLRESATNAVRDVIQPGAVNNNNNDPVTPGPSIKPQVDKLLGETINSQRNINSQGKPVLLPNNRPAVTPQ